MTDALPPLDGPSMPLSNLRPLDFSALLHYNEPFPCSPQAHWASILSPLHSARRGSPSVLDSTLSTIPFPAGSPYFGSFSPLFGTPRGLKAWGTSIPASDAIITESKPVEKEAHQSQQAMVVEQPQLQPQPQPQPQLQLQPQPQPQRTHSEQIAMLAPQPDLLRASSDVTGSPLSRTPSTLTTTTATNPAPASKPQKKPSKRTTPTMSNIDKAAERRRKNRESSSRCYYNRKRIIETLDKQISEEKSKLTQLYDKALELRHENARLKKDVVTNGIALPTKSRGSSVAAGNSAFQLRGYLQLLQSAHFYSK